MPKKTKPPINPRLNFRDPAGSIRADLDRIVEELTVRNEWHGQGHISVDRTDALAYAAHLTAALFDRLNDVSQRRPLDIDHIAQVLTAALGWYRSSGLEHRDELWEAIAHLSTGR